MRISRLSASAVAAATLFGVVAFAPSAQADDADPLGPVVSLPFDSSGAATGGAGTDTLNAAVAAQCNDGVAYTGAQWFQVTPPSGGQLQLHSQQLRWVGSAPSAEPIRTGAAVVDPATGSVVSCGSTGVTADTALAVVVYANADDVTSCDAFSMCSLEPLRLVVQLSAGAPANDSWQHPLVVGSLPYVNTVDSTLADLDGPVQPSACPFSDFVPEATGSVWWEYTPDVSGDLVASTSSGFHAEIGLVEMSPSGPKPIDWLADDAWGCDFDAVGPQVEAGKTYLIGVWQRYDAYQDNPIVNGGPVTLSLSQIQPTRPSGVSATPGDSQAQVSWTPAANAAGAQLTGYVVHVRSTDGDLLKTVTAGPDDTSAVVTGLDNGTTYVFDVAGVRGDVEGRASERSDGVTPLSGIAVPTNVTATADGRAASVTLTWDAPQADGLTGYKVTRVWDGETVTLPADATSYTATDLQPWQTYEFRLGATTSSGIGAQVSASADLTSPVPSVPLAVTATGGRTQLTVSWEAPEHEGDSAVTGYRVRLYDSRGALEATVTTGAGARSYAVTGGKLGDAATFDVTALNAAGAGPVSAQTAPVAIVHPPLPVAGVTVTDDGNGTVWLSMTPPKTSASRPVTAYRATYGNGWSQSPDPRIGVVLTPWHPTKIKVSAVNDAGLSAPVTITVTATGPAPSSPRNVKAQVGDGSVILTWDAPEHVGLAPVHHYSVVGRASDASDFVYVETDGPVTSQQVTGLHPGTRYAFSVQAIDDNASFSEESARINVTAVSTPGAPKVTGAKAGAGKATVTWQAPKLNGYSSITGYVVTVLQLRSDGSVAQTLPQPAVSRSTRSLTVDLDPGSYAFTVRAVNAVGAGPESTTSRTVATVAPAAVQGAPDSPAPTPTSAPVTPSLSPSPSPATSLAP